MKTELESTTVTYPTQPDADGFYYANEDDKESEILSKTYDNGGMSKKTKLSNGSEAVVRKLRGRDFLQTSKMMQATGEKDQTLMKVFNMSIGIKIDGETQPSEYFLDDLFQNDFILLVTVFESLNFQ